MNHCNIKQHIKGIVCYNTGKYFLNNSSKKNKGNRMNLTCISDTHGQHRLLRLKGGGDILIHAGDSMSGGHSQEEAEDFIKWLSQQDYKHKVFIVGNHDIYLSKNKKKVKDYIASLKVDNIHFLQDESVVIDGYNFYGTAWSRYISSMCTPDNWAYGYLEESEVKNKWDNIPANTDVLVTHSPAFGILDKVQGHSVSLGSEGLRDRILQINPKIHVCGHIHSGRGIKDNYQGGTIHINGASLGEDYRLWRDKKDYVFIEGLENERLETQRVEMQATENKSLNKTNKTCGTM